MTTILIGILVGIFICLFIPPKELAVKLIVGILKICDFITEKGKEQLERIEKENEQAGNTEADKSD